MEITLSCAANVLNSFYRHRPVFYVTHDAKRCHLHNRLEQENWSEEKIEKFQYIIELLQTNHSSHYLLHSYNTVLCYL